MYLQTLTGSIRRSRLYISSSKHVTDSVTYIWLVEYTLEGVGVYLALNGQSNALFYLKAASELLGLSGTHEMITTLYVCGYCSASYTLLRRMIY
jgi:hypothetical protein